MYEVVVEYVDLLESTNWNETQKILIGRLLKNTPFMEGVQSLITQVRKAFLPNLSGLCHHAISVAPHSE